MLTIRQAQMEALGAAVRDASVHQYFQYIEEKFPERVEAMGHASARDAVRRALGRAERYGIAGEGETRNFLDFEFQFGPDFDTREDMASTFDALRDPDLAPDVRLSLIAARIETAAAHQEPRPAE